MNRLLKILIVSIIPYFLDKNNAWFESNLDKILKAKKTQLFFEENTIFVEKDQQYNFSQFLRKLDEMGYEKVLNVSEPGEFAHRGGILDIFPINLNYAVRFEFLGNTIESIEKLPLEIKEEKNFKEILKNKLKSQKLFSDLKKIKPGDYLVHLDHGIGIFKGFTQIMRDDQLEDYYVLEYEDGDKLYVPKGLERKLSKYIGFVEPKISRLGGLSWQKTKKKIKQETERFAKELLEIYARREVSKRPPYFGYPDIEKKISSDFAFEETPDQIQALKDIEDDFSKEEPMDRIICGDVGFGKTEIALRTMIKVVVSGYQAAMICPTTILAHQHFQNFKERLKNLPIKIALLSRLQTKKNQKEIIEELKKGKIDIVIGTHRLLSHDVQFKNLGLLVIDDEQRFGVKQKEKFKKIRSSLDILSLSATPIPRTLYLALSSLRNISLIQTSPLGRQPIKIFVAPFSKKVIKKAIENELKRKGQVYYLHNKVETINEAKKFLESLFEKPPIFATAHGKMKEKELVKIMEDFQSKKINVLIATTIIENGLDLPNVNTLIVADATRLGLAQAYQIKGRVGRSHIQAFAYFLYSEKISSKAKMRLKILKETKELGSGYQIALKDLEMRGAGNVLGKEQSGNINKVGLNLYCQMLSETIEKIKKNQSQT